MAGEWIKMRTNLWDDPRVVAVCDRLDISEATAIGAFFWLWSMADSHSEDGVLAALTPGGVDRKVGIKGFAEAVESVGWLSISDGHIVIERFGEHNGRSAKRRISESRRKMSARDADTLRTGCGQDADTDGTSCAPRRRRRTRTKDVPNGTSPPTPPKGGEGSAKDFDPLSVDLPPELDCDSFRAAWKLWCDHRREIGKRLTPQATSQQLAKLATFGAADAVVKIETAVANGWQGVVFADSRGSPRQPKSTDKFAGNREFLERLKNGRDPIQPTDGATDGDGGQALLGG